MLTEAGYSAGDFGQAGEDAGARMAIFNGIMQATESQVGNAARYVDDFAGTQLRLSTASDTLSRSIGEALAPALEAMMQLMIPIIEGVSEWIEKHPVLTTILSTFAGIVLTVTTGLAGLNGAIIGITTAVNVLGGSFMPFLIGGAIIAGIVGITGAIKSASEEAEHFRDVTQVTNENVLALGEEYQTLSGKKNKTAEETKRLIDVSEVLAERYSEAVIGVDLETQAYRINMDVIYQNIAAREKASLNAEIKKTKEDVKMGEREVNSAQKTVDNPPQLNLIKDVTATITSYESVGTLSGEDQKKLGDSYIQLNNLNKQIKKGEEGLELCQVFLEKKTEDLNKLQINLDNLNTAEKNGNLADYYKSHKPQTQKPDVQTNTFSDKMKEYENLKGNNGFKNYQEEINYLKKIRDENAKTGEDRKTVQDLLFRLSMSQYDYLSEKEGWSYEKKIAYLNKEVLAFAYSNDLKAQIAKETSDLQGKQNNEKYQNALDLYELEASVGKKSAEEKIALFKKIMQENGINIAKSETAQKRLHQLEIEQNQENQRRAEENQRKEEQKEKERIQLEAEEEKERIDNIIDAREREIAEENYLYNEKLAKAEELGMDKTEIESNHQQNLAAIQRKYDEEERRTEDERMEIQYRNGKISYETYMDYLAKRLEAYQTDAGLFKDGEKYKTTLFKKECDTRAQYELDERNKAKQARDYSIANMVQGREKDVARASADRDDALIALGETPNSEDQVKVEEAYRAKVAQINADYDEKEKRAEDEKWAYLYDQQLISYQQYAQYLALRLNDYDEYSDEWLALQDELDKMGKDQQKSEQAAWKESFDQQSDVMRSAYEEEKKAYEGKLPWQTKQLNESREALKQYLLNCLNDANLSKEQIEYILASVAQLDEEHLTERQKRWKSFFDEIQGYINSLTSGLNFNFSVSNEEEHQEQVETISDQFSSNISGMAAKGIGTLADSLIPGIGGIVEQIASTMFDLFSSDNWEEKFEVMMEGIGEGVRKFWMMLERLLKNLPKILLMLLKEIGIIIGNIFLETIEHFVNSFINLWNLLFGWIYKIDTVDWGWKDEEAESGSKEGEGDSENGNNDNSITYGDITGPLADRFDNLIASLANLDKLQGFLDGIRSPIVEIRTDLGTIKEMMSSGKIPPLNGSGNPETSSGTPYIQIGNIAFQYEEEKNQTLDQFFGRLGQIAMGSS